MVKRLTVMLLCLLLPFLLLPGCAGRGAVPISEKLAHDEHLTCHDIQDEIIENQYEMRQLLPKTKKFWKNTAFAAAGTILIVPFVFMDFSKAEQREILALQKREDRLYVLAKQKGCQVLPPKLKLIEDKSQSK